MDAILIYLEKKGAIVPFPVKKKKRRQQPLLSPVVPFVIAFDIDGVLVRGGTPIPGAGPVLEYLVESQASPNVARRVPFIFITNGGGCLEESKATEICDTFFPELPHPIRSSQVGK